MTDNNEELPLQGAAPKTAAKPATPPPTTAAPAKPAAPPPTEKSTELARPEDAATATAPVPQFEQANGQPTSPFEGDYMDVTIAVANHLDQYEKAVNKLLNFIIRRGYAGDFVSHDKMSTPIEERTANLIGAAAERIARDLGVQELNRTAPEKHFHDQTKHPGHYYYRCEGDFVFRGQIRHAIGWASTLNPFHSRSKGRDVPPHQIREEYIMREAWRDATKQGIKALFGLRKIPVLKLKELGFDISKIKYVNYREADDDQDTKNRAATAKPDGAHTADEPVTVMVGQVTTRKYNDTPIIDVLDTDGVTYSWWGKKLTDPEIQEIVQAQRAGKPVTIEYLSKGRYRNIQRIHAAEAVKEARP